MKKFITLLLTLQTFILLGQTQNTATRIQEIKTMYAEIIQLSNANNNKQCKTGKTMVETTDNNNQKYKVEQTAMFCQVSEEYATRSAKFAGHEWNTDLNVYLKNNKIFFVLIVISAEASYDEYRVYYDSNEKVIKILNTTNNNGDIATEQMTTKEIKDKKETKRILTEVNTCITDAKKMIK